jgi:hypothetical protein
MQWENDNMDETMTNSRQNDTAGGREGYIRNASAGPQLANHNTALSMLSGAMASAQGLSLPVSLLEHGDVDGSQIPHTRTEAQPMFFRGGVLQVHTSTVGTASGGHNSLQIR